MTREACQEIIWLTGIVLNAMTQSFFLCIYLLIFQFFYFINVFL